MASATIYRPYIRWMIRRDLAELVAISRASFALPWDEEDFCRTLRELNCIGQVTEIRESVIGYMLYELHATRLEIVTLAVHPDHRRQGVGRAMIEKLIGKLSRPRRSHLCVNVPDTALDAHLFLREMGLKATEVIRGDDEDLYRMEYRVRS